MTNLDKEKTAYLKKLQHYAVIDYKQQTYIHSWAVKFLNRYCQHLQKQEKKRITNENKET